MGSAHVKWMPQFRGSALRLIAVCLVVVAVITAAVSLTVWKHEAANQRTDQSIAAFRDELLNQVRATRIAQIRLITEQQNRWNQLSALQLRQEFLLRHPRHQKTPENGN